MEATTQQIFLALATGAIANTRFSAITTDSARWSYTHLKKLLQPKLPNKQLLESWEADRKGYEAELKKALLDSNIGSDEQVLAAAQKLLKQLQLQQAVISNYSVTSAGSVGNLMASDYQVVIDSARAPDVTGNPSSTGESRNA